MNKETPLAKGSKGAIWIDSHCHVQFADLDSDLPRDERDFSESAHEIINRAVDSGVERLVVVGTDARTSQAAVDLARNMGERVSCTIGLHPHEARHGLAEVRGVLEGAIRNSDDRVVGIGECGLDYYYNLSSSKDQEAVFRQQIAWAKEFDLTLVIHSRDSWNDLWRIGSEEGFPPRTILHCFTGGVDEMKIASELDLYVSFSGVVTFKNGANVLEAARMCPPNRLLLETDSPYLSPVPFRGRTNEPSRVIAIGAFLAEHLGHQLGAFSELTRRNTEAAFQLKPL